MKYKHRFDLAAVDKKQKKIYYYGAVYIANDGKYELELTCKAWESIFNKNHFDFGKEILRRVKEDGK